MLFTHLRVESILSFASLAHARAPYYLRGSQELMVLFTWLTSALKLIILLINQQLLHVVIFSLLIIAIAFLIDLILTRCTASLLATFVGEDLILVLMSISLHYNVVLFNAYNFISVHSIYVNG